MIVWINSVYFVFVVGFYFVQIAGKCLHSEHTCRGDNSCIHEGFVCDGQNDCPDGSDETSNLCKYRPCSESKVAMFDVDDLITFTSPNHFRCGYGACVDRILICDGIANCLDGSDETEELCKDTRCRRNQFRCSYGACIHKRHRCNGRITCNDGSDETERLCSRLNRRCYGNYFRCHYGACIHNTKKCDGKSDCADSSDETPKLCGTAQVVDKSTTTSTEAAITLPQVLMTAATTHTNNVFPMFMQIVELTSISTSDTFSTSTNATNTSSLAEDILLTSISPSHASSTSTDAPLTSSLSEDVIFTSISQSHTSSTSNIPPYTSSLSEDVIFTSISPSHTSSTSTIAPPTSSLSEDVLVNPLVQIPGGQLVNLQTLKDSPTKPDKEIHFNQSETAVVYPPLFSTHNTTIPDSLCSPFECPCPEHPSICVPCLPDAMMRDACENIAREKRFCSMEVARDVLVEILHCGPTDPLIAIESEFHRLHSSGPNECGFVDGVPAETNVFVDCWGKASQMLSCQPNGKWLPSIASGPEAGMDALCQPRKINSEVCGKLPFPRRRDESYAPWPFLVSLVKDGKAFCSGTLIASRWVLTAASCFDSFQGQSENGAPITVVHSLSKLTDHFPKVLAIILHPNASRTYLQYENDLALVKLDYQLDLSEKLVPACVEADNQTLKINGVTFHKDYNKTFGWEMELITKDHNCPNNCSYTIDNHEDQFCAAISASQDIQRDFSGLPFLINEGSDSLERWTVRGVVSFDLRAVGCPSRFIFTSVSKHWAWIRDCTQEGHCFF